MYTCSHAHDHSVIELYGETFLEVSNPEPYGVTDKDGIKESEITIERVEEVTKLLNKTLKKRPVD